MIAIVIHETANSSSGNPNKSSLTTIKYMMIYSNYSVTKNILHRIESALTGWQCCVPGNIPRSQTPLMKYCFGKKWLKL